VPAQPRAWNAAVSAEPGWDAGSLHIILPVSVRHLPAFTVPCYREPPAFGRGLR
jgi:hypothetical protein